MSTAQFATFYVDDAPFGVDILQIREVIRGVACTPVPQARDEVHGLMNLRGQIVTVVDLGRRLGLGGDARSRGTCIILKTDDELQAFRDRDSTIEPVGSDAVGLLVDRMGEVVTVPAEDIDQAPANTPEADQTFLRGVVKLDGELLTLLRLRAVLGF
jgi:purine-binding chemotaxis protein CheW